jgi:hypothetical protein
VLAPAGAETHAHTDARIIVLRREQNRWNDRAVRRHLARRVAENLAMMGDEERVYRHRLRAATLFAYAFATFPDVRWLRGMLGSLLLRLGVAREN